MVRGGHVSSAGRVSAEAGGQGGLFCGAKVVDEGAVHAVAAHEGAAVAREALPHQAELAHGVLPLGEALLRLDPGPHQLPPPQLGRTGL